MTFLPPRFKISEFVGKFYCLTSWQCSTLRLVMELIRRGGKFFVQESAVYLQCRDVFGESFLDGTCEVAFE